MRRFFFVCLLLLTGCALPGQPNGPFTTPFDPTQKLDGLSYADLSAEWWKWAMSAPEEDNPVKDKTGAHCTVGQNGNVWFLAGGFGSAKIERSCTIPTGKYIFFPLINIANWQPETGSIYTCDQVKAEITLNDADASDLFAEVDGAPVFDAKKYRVTTEKCFNVFEKVPKALNPYNAYPSASDGYWILLNPLKQGQHTIKFGGKYNFSSGKLIQDIEYKISVP